jgi:hypothetical protein
MAQQDKSKRGRGRPPKIIPGIPDTLENVVKALVRPVSKREIGK